MPALDPEAEDLLVDKLLKHAPGLADISLRRSWACLRTFAPDRLPVIGWDPEIDGLFHVSGLGGFGVTTSLAIGDVASTLICGGVVDWIEVGSFSARRGALRSIPPCNN
jgi:D-arginine dehydrogenase